jgi:GNAT superfamily N-acetyltransferase
LSTWSVEPASVNSTEALALLREYFTQVSDSWFQLHRGRPVTPEEIEIGLADYPSTHLAPPTGLFLIGRYDGAVAGCIGLRIQDAATVELSRVYVRPAYRGTGGGSALLAAVEDAARELGADRIVLDTRLDMSEARALYLRNGYVEIPPYKEEKYAEVFYGKKVVGGPPGHHN